jgi:hypothetical protein
VLLHDVDANVQNASTMNGVALEDYVQADLTIWESGNLESLRGPEEIVWFLLATRSEPLLREPLVSNP